MGRLVATEYVSADGVFDEPGHWSGPFFNEEAGQFKYDELFASEAMLLGRVTYEGFAAAWPSFQDEQGFADRMNGMPKYVVSTTLEDPEWNNSHVLKGDVVAAVAELKGQLNQDLLLAGSGQVLHTLLPHGLIDEYRLMVHPIFVGHGKLLFKEGSAATLRLVETKTFSSGVVVLTYLPGSD